MTLNSRQIEQFAVTKVVKTILTSEVLSPYIADNDREPSWDGFIYLREGSKGCQRVAVQVKGKTARKVPLTPSYPISVTNLKNYLHDGGILYFVDYIVDGNDYLYYVKLAPVDLKRYIKNACGQKSIAVKLKPIKNSLLEIENDVVNFNRDCKRQTSFADAPILTLDQAVKQGHKINFEVTGIKGKEDAIRTLQKNPVYLYAEIKSGETTTYYPIGDQAYNIISGPHIKENVVVNGKTYYNDFVVFEDENKYTILVNDVLTLEMSKANDKSENNNTQLRSNATILSQKIKELSFINDIAKYKTINFGSIKATFKEIPNNELTEMERELQYWTKVQQLFKRLCIEDDVNMKEFKKEDYDNIRMLVEAIIDGKIIEHKEPVEKVCHTDIGHYRIFLMSEEVSTNKYRIINFFETESEMLYGYEDDDKEKYATSMFTVAFLMHDFYRYSNVNYDCLIPSYEVLLDKNPNILTRANYDLLLAINAYDKQEEKSERLYEAIVKLNNWLIEKSTENLDVHIINKYQIIKRKRNLEKAEKKELMSILESGDVETMAKVGINLLLENKSMAEILFDELNPSEQKFFMELPIYHFMNN